MSEGIRARRSTYRTAKAQKTLLKPLGKGKRWKRVRVFTLSGGAQIMLIQVYAKSREANRDFMNRSETFGGLV